MSAASKEPESPEQAETLLRWLCERRIAEYKEVHAMRELATEHELVNWQRITARMMRDLLADAKREVKEAGGEMDVPKIEDPDTKSMSVEDVIKKKRVPVDPERTVGDGLYEYTTIPGGAEPDEDGWEYLGGIQWRKKIERGHQ